MELQIDPHQEHLQVNTMNFKINRRARNEKANLAGFLADLSNIGALPFVIVSAMIAVAEFGPPNPAPPVPSPARQEFRITEPHGGFIVDGDEIFVKGAGVPPNRSVVLVVDGPGGRTIQNLGVDITPTGVFSGRAAIGNVSSPAGEYQVQAVMSSKPGSSVVAANKIGPGAIWSEPVLVIRE
jgi:hypothetical protein